VSKFKIGDKVHINDYGVRGVGTIVYKDKTHDDRFLCTIIEGCLGWGLHNKAGSLPKDFDTSKHSPNAKMWWVNEAELELFDTRFKIIRDSIREDLLGE